MIEQIHYGDPRVAAMLHAYLGDILQRNPGRPMTSVPADATSDETAVEVVSFTPPNGVFFGAYLAGDLVGIGGVRCAGSAALGERVGEIKRMYVAPHARRRGLARQLLQSLEDAAVAFGCAIARLDTVSVLHEARHLYESAGWHEIDRYNDNPDSQHFYAKRLDTSDEHVDGAFRRFALHMGIAETDLPTRGLLSRRIATDGPLNLRDIGGYRSSFGGHVRRGLVFRSDHLNSLTDVDRALFGETLAIATVHDFRLDVERDRQPSLYGGPWQPVVHELSTSDSSQMNVATIEIIRNVLSGQAPIPGPTFWEEAYESMLADAQPMFVKLFRSLCDPACLPSLHHCTGGKDRTGVSTALLYRVLGVSDDDIVDDFLATNLYRTPVRLASLRQGFLDVGVVPVETVPILGVTRSAIVRALTIIDEHYGRAENYLGQGGLDSDAFSALRKLLLTN